MNRIKKLRKEKGVTQQRLSMDIHVSQQYISKIENGASALTEDIILRLSKYFCVSIAYLLGVSKDRNSEVYEDSIDFGLHRWVNYYHNLSKENHETVSFLSEYLIKKQKEIKE